MTIHLDFETRGTANLLKVGATRYAVDPATQVLCMCWAFDDGPVYTWHRGHHFEPQSPLPVELLKRIASGELVEAHNAGFEWNVWNKTLRREFPEFNVSLKLRQMRCSAAKASCMSLPRALDDAAEALDLRDAAGQPIRKDPAGKNLIQKLAKPQAKRKGSTAVVFSEDPDLHRANWKYCAQDVVVERMLSAALPDMPPRELDYWLMDQRMNARGITLDVKAATTALSIAASETDRLNRELKFITDQGDMKGSRRKALQTWVNDALREINPDAPLYIANTKADTLSFALHGVPTKASDDMREAAAPEAAEKWAALGDQGDDVKRVLNICMEVNKTSTAKFKQMLDSYVLEKTGETKLHDIMLYNGADRTGRWSGKGVQPHNFPRGYSKQMSEVWDDILEEPTASVAMLWEEPLIVLAKSCRGALRASPGKELYAADFNAIEARMLAWMSNNEAMLELFRSGGDPYLAMASAIYRRECTKADKAERQMGKRAVLGLGYAMGWEKFQATVYADEGVWLEDEFCQDVVDVYRKKMCPQVPTLWRDAQSAAIKAVKEGGEHSAGGSGDIVITLTEDEIRQAMQEGETLTRMSRERGHTRNRYVGGEHFDERQGLHRDIYGAAAEIAFAKFMGLPWHPHAGKYKEVPDVLPNWEVEHIQKPGYTLPIRPDKGNGQYLTDRPYALVSSLTDVSDPTTPLDPKFRIVGYWDWSKPLDDRWRKAGLGGNHGVPQGVLTEFEKKAGPGSIAYFMRDRFLHCRLPSGRLLAYLDPKVSQRTSHKFKAINAHGKPCVVMFPSKPEADPWKVRVHAEKLAAAKGKTLTTDNPETFTQDHLSFMGRHIVTKKWIRIGTHGGSLVENADQAASRDLLAEAMLRVDQDPRFDLLLSIHDEVIAEAPIGTCAIGEFEDMMAVVPDWADGMPIAAEGWKAQRLRK